MGKTRRGPFENMKITRLYIIFVTFCVLPLDAEWSQVGDTLIGGLYSDEYGTAVDINDAGDIIAVGSPEARAILEGGDFSSGYDEGGFVEVFKNLGGTWTKLGNRILGEASDDWSGSSGSPMDTRKNSRGGLVRVLTYDGTQWVKMGASIMGHSNKSRSGSSIDLSADGLRLVVGEPAPQTSADRARVFEFVDGNWSQLGSTLLPEYVSGVTIEGIFQKNFSGAMKNKNEVTVELVSTNIDGTWVKLESEIKALVVKSRNLLDSRFVQKFGQCSLP